MNKWMWWMMAVGLGVVALLCWLGSGVAQYEYGRFSYWLDYEKNASAKVQAIAAAVQAGAAVMSLLSALVLLAVTAVYTIVTRKIARTSAGQLEASLFPMLEFDFKAVGGRVDQVDVGIKNTGQTAIKIVYCAFGGKLRSVTRPSAGGDVRFESVELKEIAGTILSANAAERKTVNLRLKGVPDKEWGALLQRYPREYALRLNCTDPRGIVKHSFVRRGDERIEYKPDFVKAE